MFSSFSIFFVIPLLCVRLNSAARISDYCLWLFELNLNVLFFLIGFMQRISIVMHMAVQLDFYSRTINLKEGSFLGDSSILWLFKFCWCVMLFWGLKYFKMYLFTASCKVIWPIKTLRRRLKLLVKNVVKFLGYIGNSKSCDFLIATERRLSLCADFSFAFLFLLLDAWSSVLETACKGFHW